MTWDCVAVQVCRHCQHEDEGLGEHAHAGLEEKCGGPECAGCDRQCCWYKTTALSSMQPYDVCIGDMVVVM